MIHVIYGDLVEDMVFSLLEKSGALDRIQRNDVVLLKPNLVFSRKDWVGVDTDPRVVEAMIKALKEKGVHDIIVGDGSGMGQSATKAFEYCGYTKMAKRYGIRLVDLEKDRFVEVPVKMDGPFDTLMISKTVHDCDFFVNIPLIKTHYQTMITCSMKNLKGTMPRAMKTKFHSVSLHKAIAQLNSALKPDLILVDGLRGDMRNETGHNTIDLNRIFLATNPVEMDSVVADILGYRPRDVPFIAYAADAGLGCCDLGDIDITSLNHPSKLVKLSAPPPVADQFPCRINAEGACCVCMSNLVFALERLKADGILSSRFTFHLGQQAKITADSGKIDIAVGNCVRSDLQTDSVVAECPPSANSIYKKVASIVNAGGGY
jgi:uncharacterized protein (DUF362 family)